MSKDTNKVDYIEFASSKAVTEKTKEDQKFSVKKVKNLKQDDNPNVSIAKVFAEAFGSRHNQTFGKVDTPCSMEFGSVVFEFEDEKKARAVLDKIELLKGQIAARKKNKNGGEFEAVLSSIGGNYKITIPFAGVKNFFYEIGFTDERYYSKLVRDLNIVQLAQQNLNLDSVRVAIGKKIKHKEVSKLVKEWVVGGKQYCAIGFGDALPLDVLLGTLNEELKLESKDKRFLAEFARWTPNEINKKSSDSRAKTPDGRKKGTYDPIKEGWLTETSAYILLYSVLLKLSKQYGVGEEKDVPSKAQELLGKSKAALFKRDCTLLALGGEQSQELKNALNDRVMKILASVDSELIGMNELGTALNEIKSDSENKLPAFIKLVTSLPGAGGANQKPTAPLYHHNLMSINLAPDTTAEGKDSTYVGRKTGARKATAILLKELGVDINIKGEPGSTVLAPGEDAILKQLFQNYPLCCSHIKKPLDGFKQRALQQSSIIISNSAGYIHAEDPKFFDRFSRELENIESLKEAVVQVVGIICEKAGKKKLTLDQLVNDKSFLEFLQKYEEAILVDYYPDIDLLYPKDQDKAPHYKAQLEADAKRLGVVLPKVVAVAAASEVDSSTEPVAGTSDSASASVSAGASASAGTWEKRERSSTLENDSKANERRDSFLKTRSYRSLSNAAANEGVQSDVASTSNDDDKSGVTKDNPSFVDWKDKKLCDLVRSLLSINNDTEIKLQLTDALRPGGRQKALLQAICRPAFNSFMEGAFGKDWHVNPNSLEGRVESSNSEKLEEGVCKVLKHLCDSDTYYQENNVSSDTKIRGRG